MAPVNISAYSTWIVGGATSFTTDHNNGFKQLTGLVCGRRNGTIDAVVPNFPMLSFVENSSLAEGDPVFLVNVVKDASGSSVLTILGAKENCG
ncbi:hypothetical protein MMC06_006154, partial [Schaereria dolodes]|nr:hypothetical protein [Schaereria dolodes]